MGSEIRQPELASLVANGERLLRRLFLRDRTGADPAPGGVYLHICNAIDEDAGPLPRVPRNPGLGSERGTDPLSKIAGLSPARPAFGEAR